VTMVVAVKVAVTVVVIVVVTFWSTLIFHGCKMEKGNGVVASFQLVPKNSAS
jgi:hypothetical protein